VASHQVTRQTVSQASDKTGKHLDRKEVRRHEYIENHAVTGTAYHLAGGSGPGLGCPGRDGDWPCRGLHDEFGDVLEISQILDLETRVRIEGYSLTPGRLHRANVLGFSDMQIAKT